MATATKKPRATRAGRFTPREFRVFENNAGDYQWVIAGANGAILGQSCPFASLADAQTAAVALRDGAAATQFEARTADTGSRVPA